MRVLASMFAVTATMLALPAQQPGGPIDIPAGARVVLQAKGDGVQIYTCTGGPEGAKWVLTAPDAKLLDAAGKIIGSHFAGPTWKLQNGSQVQGELIASQPAPEASSVAWLLLRAKGGSATGSLADVAFIRRTDTRGGVADKSACDSSRALGNTVQVPYTATYTFYAER
jgi:hypothetical protein